MMLDPKYRPLSRNNSQKGSAKGSQKNSQKGSQKGSQKQTSQKSKVQEVKDSKSIVDFYMIKFGSKLELLEDSIKALSQKQFETIRNKALPHSFRSLGILWLNYMILYSYSLSNNQNADFEYAQKFYDDHIMRETGVIVPREAWSIITANFDPE